MTALVVLLAVTVATLVAGVTLRTRSGKLREIRPAESGAEAWPALDPALAAVGVGAGVPVVLHFSAPWCGPCAAVRRVIARTLDGLPLTARDIELDLDENPLPARQLGVLSLPTTFVFDSAGRERFRVSGVPESGDLRTALLSL